jgi:hypothetical protein
MAAYFEELLRRAGFISRLERNLYLSRETERDIKFLDELTYNEVHRLISELEERVQREDK